MYKVTMNNVSEQHSDFIPWVCQYHTVKRFESSDVKTRMKALRSSSDSFISKKDVREYIFNHKGRTCYLCGEEATQIDHKKSVADVAHGRFEDVSALNAYENLFPVCAHCNSSKKHGNS